MNRTFFCFLILLFFCSPVFAVLEHGEVNIFAVGTGDGTGVSAKLVLNIKPGSGKVFTSTEPLVGTATQTTLKTAVEVASRINRDARKYDYFFSIESLKVSEVDGPSAGAASTLLVSSLLSDKSIPNHVSITGTITREGFIGSVGGIYEKVKKASQQGISLFIIPQGGAVQTVRIGNDVKKINLIEFGPQELGVTIVEVRSIDEAMALAFSDVSEIDVNSHVSSVLPDFFPDAIELPSHLLPFKKITEQQLSETESVLALGKQALSGSLVDDPNVLVSLLEILESSEQLYENAKGLNESNYLYSAANFAFLSRINALTVMHVSNNPRLLDPASGELDMLLKELETELNLFEEDLNVLMPVSGFEWVATAQQRFSYSRLYVNRLLSTRTVVVGGSVSDSRLVELRRVQDYFFAKAWLEIGKAFLEAAPESDLFALPPESFDEATFDLLEKTRALIRDKSEDDVSDILRRVNASDFGYSKGWYVGSLFDAASAYALAVGNYSFEDMDSDALESALEKTILDIEEKIRVSGKNFLWAQVYLDHARYYYFSGKFYVEEEFGSAAVNSFKTGLAIALLAEHSFLVSDSVSNFFEKNPMLVMKTTDDDFISTETVSPDENENRELSLIILGLLFVSILIAFFEVHSLRSKKDVSSISQEIDSLKNLLNELDIAFVHKKIGADEYEKKKNDYSRKLYFLLDVKQKRSRALLELDTIEAELHSFSLRFRSLKKHYRDGFLTHEEYEFERNYLRRAVAGLLEKKKMVEEKTAPVSQNEPELPESFFSPPQTQKPKVKKVFGRRFPDAPESSLKGSSKKTLNAIAFNTMKKKSVKKNLPKKSDEKKVS
jgi:hypothetical protein